MLKDFFITYYQFILLFIVALTVAFAHVGIKKHYHEKMVGKYSVEKLNVPISKNTIHIGDYDRVLNLKPIVELKKNGDVLIITPNDTIKHYKWTNKLSTIRLLNTELNMSYSSTVYFSDENGMSIPKYRLYLKPIQ